MIPPGGIQNPSVEVGMETVVLQIEGMSCGHCVHRIRTALAGLHGVSGLVVAIGSATLEREPGRVTDDDLRAAVASTGYTLAGLRVEERVG